MTLNGSPTIVTCVSRPNHVTLRSLCNNMLKVERLGKNVVSICLNSTKNIIWSLLTFFQFFWNWRSPLYDRKCCDPLSEAPFCSIRYTEMRCVWFRPPVCDQPLWWFLFDMAHTACYFKSGTPKWEWESRGCCEISQEYNQTYCPTTSRWIFSFVRTALGARTYIIRSSLGVLYKRNRVHIRPDYSSTCDVVFNPTYTSTCDVVPSPSSHTSVVASQNAPPAVNDTVAHARPPRFRRPPERLRDYVCY